MQKTILVTGSTDGIGLETAKMLVSQGHHVLVHGRNQAKLETTLQTLSALTDNAQIDGYLADFSTMAEVEALAKAIAAKHETLDVLINNAGILRAPETTTADKLDIRFAVNTLAPYLLTQRLLPLIKTSGRVINLSSAAQSPVDLEALAGRRPLAEMAAYSQSKLALTIWSRHLALALKAEGPAIIAVNPGSLLASKMVKEGFGIAGNDIRIGADILIRASLSDEFEEASGQYFDNDSKSFASPHPDALNAEKSAELVRVIEKLLATILGQAQG
uniref:SDR family NAD(P)-dependent oxidoreductase n=1 Tax=Marinobacterium profundum TaxID=1714300 RepID=UPI0008326538|nr:SDR family NAD(P)-dependent oxidoreductase [Marinobacterium profundum]